jgi:hypothetical protein
MPKLILPLAALPSSAQTSLASNVETRVEANIPKNPLTSLTPTDSSAAPAVQTKVLADVRKQLLRYHGVTKADFDVSKFKQPLVWYVVGFVPSGHEPEDVRNFTQAFKHASTNSSWALHNNFRRCGSNADEETVYKLTRVESDTKDNESVTDTIDAPHTKKTAESLPTPTLANASAPVADVDDNAPLISFDVERAVDIPFVTQFTGIRIPERYRFNVNYIKKDMCKCAVNPNVHYTFMVCSKPDKTAYWLLAQTPFLSKNDLLIAKNVIDQRLGVSWERMHFVAHLTV